MGEIQSVSLPAGTTCVKCGCYKKCYARRIAARRKVVRDAYERNLYILNNYPQQYWREVESVVMISRYFRFHVSGDIPDHLYFANMVRIAARNQHCQILCFTKNYEVVNQYIKCGFHLPYNLHIIFSAWPGYEMDNPYQFPEAHVRFKNGTTTADDQAKPCSGNCTDCALTDAGCWILQRGEQVVFDEH